MAGNGKKYSSEFKEQIVNLHKMGKKISHLSNEYGISRATIHRWVVDSEPIVLDDGIYGISIKNNKNNKNNKNKNQVTKKEYEQMLKEIKELRLENEILKKATAIFAKEQ